MQNAYEGFYERKAGHPPNVHLKSTVVALRSYHHKKFILLGCELINKPHILEQTRRTFYRACLLDSNPRRINTVHGCVYTSYHITTT
jgi:hypothetical protein